MNRVYCTFVQDFLCMLPLCLYTIFSFLQIMWLFQWYVSLAVDFIYNVSFVSQCSAYSGFGHGTQHTVLRTLYAVQPLPQFFTWSPLQQNYMVSSVKCQILHSLPSKWKFTSGFRTTWLKQGKLFNTLSYPFGDVHHRQGTGQIDWLSGWFCHLVWSSTKVFLTRKFNSKSFAPMWKAVAITQSIQHGFSLRFSWKLKTLLLGNKKLALWKCRSSWWKPQLGSDINE